MNKFEQRYFPLKRAYPRRSLNFCRCRGFVSSRRKERGKLLTALRCSIPDAPGCAGKRLVFIADWHWHDSPRNFRLLEELKRLLAANPADALLLGGDMCDDACLLPQLPPLLRELGRLAPVTLAVGGNWEAGKRWLDDRFFRRLYADCGITLLENDTFSLGNFRFFGMPDISSVDFTAAPRIPEKRPGVTNILLLHSPDAAVSLDRENFLDAFHLALCGHTHGGQVRLPLIGAFCCRSFYGRRFDRGAFIHTPSGMKMLVSQGIGEHRGHFRLFCPPEAVILEFT